MSQRQSHPIQNWGESVPLSPSMAGPCAPVGQTTVASLPVSYNYAFRNHLPLPDFFLSIPLSSIRVLLNHLVLEHYIDTMNNKLFCKLKDWCSTKATVKTIYNNLFSSWFPKAYLGCPLKSHAFKYVNLASSYTQCTRRIHTVYTVHTEYTQSTQYIKGFLK